MIYLQNEPANKKQVVYMRIWKLTHSLLTAERFFPISKIKNEIY